MLWWKVFVLTVAFFSECVCKSPRIFNGRDASIEDFPYQASIRYFGFHSCGGSITSERHILTAAHCVKTAPPYTGATVVTGTSKRYEEGNSHEIDKIKVHSNYSKNENRGWNDIAVITLKNKIIFDKYQQKINLPEHNPEIGQQVNVTGWGWTRQIPIIRPHQLQLLQTQIAPNEDCQKKVIDPKTTEIYDTEVCTLDGKGTGPCAGDSGGPLVANGVVFGITAWGDGDYCGSGTPSVFTNVYKFKEFIETAMKDTSVMYCGVS